MTRYPLRSQLLATMLAALAGYVDAVGFLAAGGYFVSFMSGNSTRLAVGLSHDRQHAVVAAGLLAAFLAGVVSGALVGHAAGRQRRGPLLLALVAIALSVGARLHTGGSQVVAIVCMAAAMGLMNNVFEEGGEVSIGVTYMTGSLVKLGQRLAAALLGRDRRGWIPFFLLWSGFVSGATLGALAHASVGLASLWVASAAAAVLALSAPRLAPPAAAERR